MSTKYKEVIVYNCLLDIAPQLNICDRDITIVKHAVAGEKNADIARMFHLSPSRINQILWKYVIYCERLTGLIYFEDMPPITREQYNSYFPLSHRNTYEDILRRIRHDFFPDL